MPGPHTAPPYGMGTCVDMAGAPGGSGGGGMVAIGGLAVGIEPLGLTPPAAGPPLIHNGWPYACARPGGEAIRCDGGGATAGEEGPACAPPPQRAAAGRGFRHRTS